MERQETLKKMVEFQKTYFDITFDMMVQMQDQTQSMIKDMLDKTPTNPEKGVAIYSAWMDACQKGRQVIKSTVDNNFEAWSTYFEQVS